MSKANNVVRVLLFNFFFFFFFFLLGNNIAYARTTFFVGDARGWTFNVSSWPDGKYFRTGDWLLFQYPVGKHDVIEVNEANFKSCTPDGRRHTTGSDEIPLQTGTNYFICGFLAHCEKLGMKIAVTAN